MAISNRAPDPPPVLASFRGLKFSLRSLMTFVACVALFLGLFRLSWPIALLLIGPVVGGAIQIARDGEVIPGSITGAVATNVGFAVVCFVGESFSAHPVKPRAWRLFEMVASMIGLGVLFGFLVGATFWIGAAQIKTWRTRAPRDPPKPGTSLDSDS